MEVFAQWIAESTRLITLGNRRNQRDIRRALAEHQIIRVYRNAYIPTEAFTGLDGWQLADAVLAARITSVSTVRGPSSPLSHSTALIAYGSSPLHIDHREIHVLKTRGTARPDTCPPITFGTHLLAPRIPIVAHQCNELPEAIDYPHSFITCVHPRLAAAQCATSFSPDRAVCSTSAALRLLSSFDRFEQAESRQREERERRKIADLIENMPSTRGRVHAQSVIAAADAGCESVQERRLLWILKAMGFRNVRTQVEYFASGSKLYVDFEIDRGRIRLIIEFDGKTKYGNTPKDILASLTDRDQREKLLVAEGLTVVRFESFELDNPQKVAEEVARALRMKTLPRPRRLLLDT